MKQNSSSHASNSTPLNLDMPFIHRTIRRWLFVALCAAMSLGMLVLVYMNQNAESTYTATALVTVAARNNKTSYLASYYLNSAITHNVSMWNSSAMTKAIQAANPGIEFKGRLNASEIKDSGLVQLTATASTAKEAFFLLSEATKNYTSIAANFDTDYRTVILTAVNADCVSETHNSVWQYGVFGFAVGLIITLGFVFVWAVVTDVLHNETQARNLLDVPVLGHLVRVKHRSKEKNILLSRAKLPVEYLEEINVITSQLERTMRRDNKKLLMVTSVFPNDGKSSVTANVALTLAKRDRKVLLVEMDLRSPSIYDLFGLEKRKGLSWTRGVVRNMPLSQFVIPCPEIKNLDLLCQFQSIGDADSFLENGSLKERFEELSENYDYILFDTPPMWGIRDAEVVAQTAQGSLLMIRQDRCHARMANDVLDRLENCGAPCLGVVLNHCRGLYAHSHVNEAYGYHQFYRGAQK